MTEFIAVIPARYESSRLPGKPLVDIGGRPMIAWVHQQAVASGATDVIIATDDHRVSEACRAFGARVEMTSPQHASGTDRIAEVAERLAWPDDRIVVNVQGDEPMLPPQLISQAAQLLAARPDAAVATLMTPPRDSRALDDVHTAKVVVDREGNALYFSRAPIPRARDGGVPPIARCHVGLYAYRAGSLRAIAAAPPCELELTERLEQLRALYLGLRIVVADAAAAPAHGVDTPADLEAIRAMLAETSVD